MTARPGAAGFSLLEVVVAVGLLAGVLFSTAALLTVGSRQVTGGRYSTEALSVARDVIEKLEGFSYGQLVDQLGCEPAESTCILDSDAPGAAALWKPRLEQTMPAGAHLEVRVEGLDDAALSTDLGAAAALRLSISILWDEGPRRRDVRLVLVRT